jgi:hypothetical protein
MHENLLATQEALNSIDSRRWAPTHTIKTGGAFGASPFGFGMRISIT